MEKHSSGYRWVVFAVVILTYSLIVSQRTAPGLITDQLMKDYGLAASAIGLLSSIQFLAYSGLQIPIGLFSDRFGPNIFLILGTLVNGIGTVLYSVAPNEPCLLIARLLVGAGDATIWVNLILILSQWFRAQEFMSLIGFAGMGGSVGFLLATYPLAAWLSRVSWHVPFLVVGIILCLMSVALYVLLVQYPKGRLQGIGLIQPIGGEAKREKLRIVLWRVIKERNAWATFLCHFGLVGTYVGFIGSWAVPYGIHVYGLTRGQASQLIMIGLVGAILGAPASTWLANRFGSIKRPYSIIHMIVFISWGIFLVFGGRPPFALFILLFFIIGYGNGASSLTFAAVRRFFHIREVGVVSGFANTGGFLSAVLLPSLFGAVLDHYPSTSLTGYKVGFLIPVCFSLLGIFGGFLLKERKVMESNL
ncbi:MFS transporter [Pullulanibacillus sp. KACC 23026]|uniref:MFS transporter n=1 Tax=Pullulanibacillus sp. KACC 23026 TaxID=3028315 RepID=UPI0023B1DCA4|nr:MFS transporter [Pullulanibacillus sp. KACC 23026]WEG12922.1 MFS transporter [Pullulanibacillus sp. KACC 23026]